LRPRPFFIFFRSAAAAETNNVRARPLANFAF